MVAHTKTYSGFISYSHANRRAAEKLLRKLQTYRLPKGATPQDSRKLGRFFMDRETLPASGELSEAIISALRDSEALIVICSPAAVVSHWVNKEVETFRQLNPEGSIITAVIEGDPAARTGDQVCFPPALLNMADNPLAADFRKVGDGPALGFLKIAASLSGARLSALLQRDSKRKRRRFVMGLVTTSAIALMMTGLSVVALTARQDAIDRHADAEDLVDFMLGDLKDKLEPVGRLSILESVADHALAYYNDQETAQLDCAATARHAKAINLKSQILVSQDELDAARSASENAIDLLNASADECTGNTAFRLTLASANFYAARPVWGRGIEAKQAGDVRTAEANFHAALTHYRNYDAAIAPLKDNPEVRDLYLQEYADNQINFGSTYFHLGQTTEALAHFTRAEQVIAELTGITFESSALPSFTSAPVMSQKEKAAISTQANALSWQSTVHEAVDEFARAQVPRQSATWIYQHLSGSEEARDWSLYRQYLGGRLALLRLARKQGDDATANNLYTNLHADTVRLIENDPENTHWQRLLTIVEALNPQTENLQP